MLKRLADAYDAIGHSSGRPYLYFVYPPDQELEIRRKAEESMVDNGDLSFAHIDLVRLTGESIRGQEAARTALLTDEQRAIGARASLMRMWARRLTDEIRIRIQAVEPPSRLVVVLHGTAALYPVGNPTILMETLAENEIRSPHTREVVPVVLLVPGRHIPDASRTYLFLGREDQRLSFYRGEEI